jgi:hypothetical protein
MFGSVEKWPGWWNGRHRGLKSLCSKGRAGSNPAPGTSSALLIAVYSPTAELAASATAQCGLGSDLGAPLSNLYARAYLRESRFVGSGCNTPNMYNQATRDRALALIGDGLSLRAISQITGVSRATLKDWREHPRRRDSRPTAFAAPRNRACPSRSGSTPICLGCISEMGASASLETLRKAYGDCVSLAPMPGLG